MILTRDFFAQPAREVARQILGARLVRITAPSDKPWARVEVRASTDDRDPALLVDVQTTTACVTDVEMTEPVHDALARRPLLVGQVDLGERHWQVAGACPRLHAPSHGFLR